jgi:hypothetical protein
MPREATSTQKSPWTVITSSRTSTSFSILPRAPRISSAERLTSSDLAPTELKIPFSRAMHWVAKLKHLFRRVLTVSLSLRFFSTWPWLSRLKLRTRGWIDLSSFPKVFELLPALRLIFHSKIELRQENLRPNGAGCLFPSMKFQVHQSFFPSHE